MKILMINHFPLTGSGSGVYTINIAKSLINKGHEVAIITPEITKNYVKYEGVKTHPVYFKKDEIIDSQLDFNFPCFTTHPFSNNSFYNLSDEELQDYKDVFIKAIEEEIDEFKPDIIHSGHIWVLSALASNYNLPLIITAHGTDLLGYEQSERYRDYANIAASKCDKIITISEDNSNLVAKIFPNCVDKTVYIKNGYDANIFYPDNIKRENLFQQLGITREYKNVISFAGKLTHIKGVDTLLQAASEYSNNDTLTIIAGNGELYDQLNKLKETLKLKDVIFTGNVDHDMLRKIFSIADISIVPSRSEAFGLVAIEAMACGTPVIATNQGGLPGIINEKVGSLIEVGDYHSLANQISVFLKNKDMFNRDYIANYALDNYSQDKLIDRLIDIYEEAINNNYKKVR